MPRNRWKQWLEDSRGLGDEGRFPIAAYSEFLPPIRLGRLRYGRTDPTPFDSDEPWAWPITEAEEAYELAPGLETIAHQPVGALVRLGRGDRSS